MNLTFQVPLPYCSSHHQTLFSPADACTTECHFHFGPVTSFLLELLGIALCLPTIEYWTPSDQRASSSTVISFCLSYCPWGSPGKNMKCVAIFYSSGPHFVRTLHYDPPWAALHSMAHNFIEIHKSLCQNNAVSYEG